MSRELGADHALNASEVDPVAAIRELTGGNGADVVFECAGGSPKQGLAGHKTLLQAIDAVRSGGKVVGVSWFGGPLELDVDLLRERSLRYLFPDISTLGAPGTHGPARGLGPRAAEADDHARPAGDRVGPARRSRSRRTRGSTRRSTPRR